MKFCKACECLTVEDLYSQLSGSPVHTVLYASYSLLKGAALDGCNNCQIFQGLFDHQYGSLEENIANLEISGAKPPPVIVYLQAAFLPNRERPIIKFHIQIGDGPERPGVESLRVSFRVSRSWGKAPTIQITIGTHKNIESSHANKQTSFTFRYTELDHDLGSDRNFGIALNWIRTCCSEHDPAICPALVDVELPTRLLDVGSDDDKESLRLIETSKGQLARYLAFSHCWGPPETKKLLTTTETLSSRLKFIDQADMPPNFSDAVTITRRLGYKYLWIDSLCIIQDSKSDWESESQNMGRIYTNAALTLAAAAATSSDGGMLTTSYQPVSNEKLSPKNWFLTDSIGRSHTAFAQDDSLPKEKNANSELPPCRIKLDHTDEERNVILHPLTEFSDLEENWFRCTVLGPLALRGWCLQEKLLSRRVLYYGHRQIYWQCASARKAADGEDVPASAARSQANMGNELSDWPDVLSLQKYYQAAINSGSLEQRQIVQTKIYKTWHNILFLFINRRLTYDSDRLPSLAGMASLIHEITHDRYVAGFWLGYLRTSLLWTGTRSILKEDAPRVIADRYEIKTPEWEKAKSKFSGPSWSWCSAYLEDFLDFWADHDETYRTRFWKEQDVEVVDVSVKLMSTNPFGQVDSGELILRGYTYPRWDVRELDPGGWRIYSTLILGFCPHSPWNRNRGNESGSEDRSVLWDYWPRQELPPALRMLKHIFRWLLDVLMLLLWQGMSGFNRQRGATDCGACRQYLCMHVLSILDKDPGKNGMHEVDLWSLILEPVPGTVGTYRRVGIARKAAYVPAEEVRTGTQLNDGHIPRLFQNWKHREVIII